MGSQIPLIDRTSSSRASGGRRPPRLVRSVVVILLVLVGLVGVDRVYGTGEHSQGVMNDLAGHYRTLSSRWLR